MSQQFKRTIEDFTCEHCGAVVEGDGYTNHCPRCLWSKHVDVFPGDRQHSCQGLMAPAGVALEAGEFVITHRCSVCGAERPNRAAPGDDLGEYLGSVLQ